MDSYVAGNEKPPGYRLPSTTIIDTDDALKPDPGTGREFEMEKNPFAFSPGQLGKLLNPKNIAAMGGLRGLEKGLKTDLKNGLSLDELYPERRVSFEDATGKRKSIWALNFGGFIDILIILLMTQPNTVEIIADMAVIIVVDVYSGMQYRTLINREILKRNKMEEVTVRVIRSGKPIEIPKCDLLVGDVCCLEAGDFIYADGVFISGHNVQCDEYSVTGESDPVKKCPTSKSGTHNIDPFIISGTKVLEGVGTFLVTGFGGHSTFEKTTIAPQKKSTYIHLQNTAELTHKPEIARDNTTTLTTKESPGVFATLLGFFLGLVYLMVCTRIAVQELVNTLRACKTIENPTTFQVRSRSRGTGAQQHSLRKSTGLQGLLNGQDAAIFADNGSEINIITEQFAAQYKILIDRSSKHRRRIPLANGKFFHIIGKATAIWAFKDDPTKRYEIEFEVALKCIHGAILGNEFLNQTESLKKKLEHRLVDMGQRYLKPVYLSICNIGTPHKRLPLLVRGKNRARAIRMQALPDIGAEGNILSEALARRNGFRFEKTDTEFMFPDGTIERSLGRVRLEFSFEGSPALKSISALFEVMRDSQHEAILGHDFVFDHGIYEDNNAYRLVDVVSHFGLNLVKLVTGNKPEDPEQARRLAASQRNHALALNDRTQRPSLAQNGPASSLAGNTQSPHTNATVSAPALAAGSTQSVSAQQNPVISQRRRSTWRKILKPWK